MGVVVSAADIYRRGGGGGDTVGKRQRVDADGCGIISDVGSMASHIEGIGGAVHRAVDVVVIGKVCVIVAKAHDGTCPATAVFYLCTNGEVVAYRSPWGGSSQYAAVPLATAETILNGNGGRADVVAYDGCIGVCIAGNAS